MRWFPLLLLPFLLVACSAPRIDDAPAPSASSIIAAEIEQPGVAPGPGRVERSELARPSLRQRPEAATLTSCSRVVCVHFASAADGAAAALMSEVASAALETYAALHLPRPLADAGGGDGRLDVYLDRGLASPAAYGEPGSTGVGVDRSAAFIMSPPLGSGCVQRQALAGAVGTAMLLGQDAALGPNERWMLGEYLGTLAAPCTVREMQAVDLAARTPERTFTGRLGQAGDASFLFPWFLEDNYGTQEPGKLAVALAAISSQKNKGDLRDEPDVFDALRVTQQRNGTSSADTLLDFAVQRAFVGSRSDGTHMFDVAKYGDLGRPRIEWNVAYKSLPRRLAPLRPIEPLGTSYLMVDVTGAPTGAELTFVAEWESPVAFRWAMVKIDKDGAEIGRQEVTPVLGETRMEKSVRELGGSAYVLVVGLNEGESTRDEPFDPGELREGARSYLLTIYP